MKDKPLPNSCAISSCAEAWLRLKESGAPSRILAMVFRDGESHATTAFQSPDGVFFLYDPMKGSRRLSGVTMDTPPMQIARRMYGSQIVGAKWIDPEPAPKIRGANRRLSPREVRSCLPAFDRLLEQQAMP